MIFDPDDPQFVFDAISVSIHAINTVMAVIEIFSSAISVRILHMIYPMIFGAVYIIFSVIYWAAGGKEPYNEGNYVYKILDYGDEPERAAGAALTMVLVVVPIIHVIVWVLYKLREKLCHAEFVESRVA